MRLIKFTNGQFRLTKCYATPALRCSQTIIAWSYLKVLISAWRGKGKQENKTETFLGFYRLMFEVVGGFQSFQNLLVWIQFQFREARVEIKRRPKFVI